MLVATAPSATIILVVAATPAIVVVGGGDGSAAPVLSLDIKADRRKEGLAFISCPIRHIPPQWQTKLAKLVTRIPAAARRQMFRRELR